LKKIKLYSAIAAVLLLLLLPALALPARATAASAPEKVIYDRADILSDAQESEITTYIQQAWQEADCAFYLATHLMFDNVKPYTGEAFLKDMGLPYNPDLVLLVITMEDATYFYDIYRFGDAETKIPQKECDIILDNADVYDNLKAGQPTDGCEAFFSLTAQAYNGRMGVSYGIIGLISFAIALVIGLISCAGVKAAYSMKHRSVDYPLDRFAKLKLTEQSDVFTGSFVTKRVIQSSSSSSGGSSHGGGRGHGGGR
jgi:uncharacterized membrane protein YgcG